MHKWRNETELCGAGCVQRAQIFAIRFEQLSVANVTADKVDGIGDFGECGQILLLVC